MKLNRGKPAELVFPFIRVVSGTRCLGLGCRAAPSPCPENKADCPAVCSARLHVYLAKDPMEE